MDSYTRTKGWRAAPDDAMRAAMANDPTGAMYATSPPPSGAANAAGAVQGGGAKRGGGSVQGGGSGVANTGTGSSQPGAMSSTGGAYGAAAPVDPNSYSSDWINNSNEWYGKGNEYGASAMARDSGTFWSGYGDQVAGFQPGGNAESFLANKYDLQSLGAAMYGKDFVSDEGRLAGQTAIANRINSPGVQFFDPGQIIGSTLAALQSSDPESLAQQSPMLAALLQSVSGNPIGQVGTILGFFESALSATMPPDALSAFLGQLESLGRVFQAEILRNPNNASLDDANFATFLTQRLGPTLGL